MTQLPQVGDLVAGKYRLLSVIGQGGYGVVYRARQDAMGRDVALKMLRPEAAVRDEEVERFRREVFHASCLRHPNTITLHDYGQTEAGELYIAMEYLRGMNVAQRLRVDGAFEHDEALDVVMQVLRSLREAHNQGILHRDVKPENIYLADIDGEAIVKMLDFGLSKAIGTRRFGARTLTKDGQVHGTPQYMSPEQACAVKLTSASDLYALGLVTWEMLTGRPAYTGSTPVDVLLKQVNDPTPSLPSQLSDTLLAAFIERATKKRPERRFEDARRALDWLEQQVQTASMHAPIGLEEPSKAHHEGLPQASARRALASTWDYIEAADQLAAENVAQRARQLPMLGRSEALRELLVWGQQALRTGGVLWVEGEAGCGKTRLLSEWTRHLRMHDMTLLRDCVHPNEPPMAAALRAIAPLRREPHIQEFPEAIVRRLDAIDIDQIGRTSATIEEALYAAAQLGPVMFVLEEVQHASPQLDALIERWGHAMAARALPLLLVFSRRVPHSKIPHHAPSLLVNQGAIEHGATSTYAMRLRPLEREATREIIEELAPLDEALSERLVDASRGNPQDVIEIVRHLFEQNALSWHAESHRWRMGDERGGAPLLSPAIFDERFAQLIASIRAHRLSGALMALLARAMFLDDRFGARTLRDLLRREGRADLEGYFDDAIEALIDHGALRAVVEGNRPMLETDDAAALRERVFALHSFGTGERERLHALAAQIAIERIRRDGAAIDVQSAHTIASHWHEAGHDDRALEWLLRTASEAEATQRFEFALQMLERAQQMLRPQFDPSGERLLAVRLAQGRVYTALGRFSRASDTLHEAIEETRSVGDEVGEALVMEALAHVEMITGRRQSASDLYNTLRERYTRFHDERGLARVGLRFAEISHWRGEVDAADEAFAIVAGRAKLLGDRRTLARSLYGRARCAFGKGQLDQARHFYQIARKRAEALGDLSLCADADVGLATLGLYMDHIEVPLALARSALALKQKLGDTLGLAQAHLTMGMCLRRTHRLDEAVEHARTSHEICTRIDHHYGVAKAALLMGEIAWLRADMSGAREWIEVSKTLHAEIGDHYGSALCGLYEATIALFTREAPEDVEPGLALAAKGIEQGGIELYRAEHMCLRAMNMEQDHLEDSLALQGEALDLAQRQGNVMAAALCAAAITRARLRLGDVAAALHEAPLALSLAEQLGHTHLMIIALSLSALTLRLERRMEEYQSMVRRLRVLMDSADQLELNMSASAAALASGHQQHVGTERAFPLMLAAVDLMQGDGGP